MNTFVLEVFDDEGKACTFYTVRRDGEAQSETEKFLAKFKTDKELREKLDDLLAFLFVKIAEDTGALPAFFRQEDIAQALPPSKSYTVGEVLINYSEFPLRLYCLRISNQLVVLFNGGEKTSRSAQGGKTATSFRDAQQFAARIDKALQNKDVEILSNGRVFSSTDGSEEILLY